MSILAEALKKSQRDQQPAQRCEAPTDLRLSPVGADTKQPPSPRKISVARISTACALIAIGLSVVMAYLSTKTPVNNQQSRTLSNIPTPKLDGIVWDSESGLVVLDGKPLKVGDEANGWVVQSITASQVSLSRDGVGQILTLSEVPARK